MQLLGACVQDRRRIPTQSPEEAMTDTEQTDEQAETLREWVIGIVVCGAHQYGDDFAAMREDGRIHFTGVDDGTEYAIHVLPEGELERLQAERTLTSRMSEEIAAYEALIDKLHAIIDPDYDTTFNPMSVLMATRLADIRTVLARYDEKGTKVGGVPR